MRLGKPTSFFEDIDADVLSCVEAALASLVEAGVEIVDVDIPDPNERDWIFPAIAPPEFLAAIGEKGFRAALPGMDPTTGARAEKGLSISGMEHAAAVIRHHQLAALAEDAFRLGWMGFADMPFFTNACRGSNRPKQRKNHCKLQEILNQEIYFVFVR